MTKLLANERLDGGRLNLVTETTMKPVLAEETVKQIRESATSRLILKPKIAAIHEGRTLNNTIYKEEKLRGVMAGPKGPTGMYSFLYPYRKPMIKNHDVDEEPLGRIGNVQYVKTALTPGYVMIVPHITDPETIEKVLDGRYLTVSIGASTDSVVCNVCGSDLIVDGFCEHERGVTYDGTVCGWILGDLTFNEVSWVNVPADINAQVMDAGEVEIYATSGEEGTTETFDVSTGIRVTESVSNELGLNIAEGTNEQAPVVVPEETPEIPAEESAEETPAEVTEEVPETVETTEQTEGAAQAAEDTKTEESEADATAQEEETPGNAPEETQEVPEANVLETEIAALRQELADALTSMSGQTTENERLTAEVDRLNRELAQRDESIQLATAESITFLRTLIQEESETYELTANEEITLETLDLTGLQEHYRTVKSQSGTKYQDLSKFKVPNPNFGNLEEVAKPDGTESKDPPKIATAVEIYGSLLRPKKTRK